MPTPTVTGESTPDGGGTDDDGNNIIDDDTMMCSFCNPDGVEFPDIVLPTDDGTTCTIASEYAATLLANDVMCPTVLMAEALCCPNNSGGGGEGTDDEPRPEPCEGNIVDVAMENEDFTTLVEAVTAAGLVDELSGEGPFTVFGTSFFFCYTCAHTHQINIPFSTNINSLSLFCSFPCLLLLLCVPVNPSTNQ